MGYSEQAIDYVKEFLKSADAYSPLGTRVYKESVGKDRDRNPFHRDYARIIYSPSFRRLQGKMQLLGVKSDQFFRNRLTHSLEVSQIARTIAYGLGYTIEDSYVIEACSLAHDIGNPPFGHFGEKILNEIARDIGGFEGNAQTLRLLTKLEKKMPNIPGLNLSIRTLLGVTKYFKKNEGNNRKFIYDEDYSFLQEYIDYNNIKTRTVDVQIIDIADEIAYAAHDLEDALSMKLFTIEELIYEFELLARKDISYEIAYKKIKSLINKSIVIAKKGDRFNSSEEYAFLFRKELTSRIVHTLISDVDLIEVTSTMRDKTGTLLRNEIGLKELSFLAKGLKDITFRCINRTDIIQIYEKQGEKVIKGLYNAFSNYKFNNSGALLPVEYRPIGSNCSENKRLIIDYLAGMMDYFAISTYEKLFGKSELEKIFDSEIFKYKV